MEDTLHFKLGKGFGKILSEISREYIIKNNDPESAYQVFSKSGAPPECALELLSGDMVIVVNEDEESCSVVDYDSLSPEEKDLYQKPISWSDWANKKVRETLDQGILFIGTIKGELYKGSQKLELYSEELFKKLYNIPDKVSLGYTWLGYCSLEVEDILSFWGRRDLLEIEDNIYILKTLSGFDKFLQDNSKLIQCVSWIYEQYGGENKEELQSLQNLLYTGNILLNLISDYRNNQDRIHTILSVYIAADIKDNDNVVMYINKDRILKERVESLKPVDITKGWDAGYISPSGKVYALCGDSCQFLHMQLADQIYELYGWTKPKENIDWELDRRGWLKFHTGECLYAGYSVNPEIPITIAQKAELIRYAKSQVSIKCGYDKKVVTEDDLIGQPEEYYEQLFG